MNNILFDVRFKKLIKDSLSATKNKFLTFAENEYGVKGDIWQDLWNIPVFSSESAKEVIPKSLPSKYTSILKKIIDERLGNSEAVFIPNNKFIENFSEELNIDIQDIPDSLSTIPSSIVYNEKKLKEVLNSFINFGKNEIPPKTAKENNDAFKLNLTSIFLHEYLHANTEVTIESSNYTQHLNGVQLFDEEENLHPDLAFRYSEEFNEIFLTIVADIINMHSKELSIEDCLYKIIHERNGKSSFKYLDDKLILSMFSLFSQEFCHWTLFERFSNSHVNILKEKFIELFGVIAPSLGEGNSKKIGDYFNRKIKESNFPKKLEKQKEMLEMLDIKNINFNDSLEDSLNKLISRIKGNSQASPSDSENKYSPSQRNRTTNMNIGE